MVDKQRPPRVLHLPPTGRPRWVSPENAQLDLLYLSWGQRRYGRNAIPVSLHHGWIYAYVRRGRPILSLLKGEVRAQAGDMLIIHPNCASGWKDSARGRAELITWLWRTPPRCSSRDVTPETYHHFSASKELRRTVTQIHRRCRDEVEMPDAFTPAAIEQLRLALDVAVARSHNQGHTPLQPAMRLELALAWLAQNLTERRPVSALCRYLQVSPITVNRLFRTYLGESASASHHRMRMQHARDLIDNATGSVKEIGFKLGYRHPNDFSRAIKKATGERAGRLLRQARHRPR